MASSASNAGSFGDNTEGNTPAAKDCPLHPGPNRGACEACMDDLKMELATTRDLLTRATANEERKSKDLLIASILYFYPVNVLSEGCVLSFVLIHAFSLFVLKTVLVTNAKMNLKPPSFVKKYYASYMHTASSM